MPKKFKINKIDVLLIGMQFILVAGVISSYFNFGLISVMFSVLLPIIFILVGAFTIYAVGCKRKYYSLIGIVIFLFSFNFFYHLSDIEETLFPDAISLLSYNVRTFNQPISDDVEKSALTEIVRFVDSINPDILLLQEFNYVKARDKKITDYPYEFLGYREGVSKSLLAIYSKYEIIEEGYIDFPNTLNNAIYVDLKIKRDTIRIYNVHLQSYLFNKHIFTKKFNNFSFWRQLNRTLTIQIEQANLVKEHARNSNRKVIICGDFNATPYSYPFRIMKNGLHDSFASKGNGTGETYSLLDLPLRIDNFLGDEGIEILSHQNFDLNLSDHEPIVIKFKLK